MSDGRRTAACGGAAWWPLIAIPVALQLLADLAIKDVSAAVVAADAVQDVVNLVLSIVKAYKHRWDRAGPPASKVAGLGFPNVDAGAAAAHRPMVVLPNEIASRSLLDEFFVSGGKPQRGFQMRFDCPVVELETGLAGGTIGDAPRADVLDIDAGVAAPWWRRVEIAAAAMAELASLVTWFEPPLFDRVWEEFESWQWLHGKS